MPVLLIRRSLDQHPPASGDFRRNVAWLRQERGNRVKSAVLHNGGHYHRGRGGTRAPKTRVPKEAPLQICLEQYLSYYHLTSAIGR